VLVVSTLGLLLPGRSPRVLVAGLLAWLVLVAIHVRAVRGRVRLSSGVLAG
jgi:hypothetical protein